MKRILLIATSPLQTDGLTKVEMDILAYHREAIAFEVACGDGFNNSFGDLLREAGVPCHELPPRAKILSHMRAVRRLVSDGEYDGVYIHGNSTMMILESLPAKRGHARRVITHCHNARSHVSPVRAFLKPFFNVTVDVKIACSAQAAWVYNKRRVEVITNGVELDRFRFDPEARARTRRELDCEDALLVGHVGRFSEQKNHKKLIEIFAELHAIEPKARLLLLGEGELEEEVRQQVASLRLTGEVCFLGARSEVRDYYQAMDLMLLPSRYEGLCLVAIEAQAAGLPILLSDRVSPETLATESAAALPLEEEAKIWAQKALALPRERRDNTALLRSKGFDRATMMERIRALLTEG